MTVTDREPHLLLLLASKAKRKEDAHKILTRARSDVNLGRDCVD